MENIQTQNSEPVIVDSMGSGAPVAMPAHPKVNKGMLATLAAVTVIVGSILVYAFMNAGANKVPTNTTVTEMPTADVTETPTPTVSGTPLVTTTVTQTPMVQGTAYMTYIDGDNLQVFTKDLNRIATIKIDENASIVPCFGPVSGYCIVSGKTIKAVEVNRAGKLVATHVFSINFGKDELTPYVPYIDLTRQEYVYLVSDAKDEMKVTYYKKTFSGTQSAQLLTWESGGVSGYNVDSILSTGEVVFHNQGSVYTPGDPRTLMIVNEQGKSRNCQTKEYFDVYSGNTRIFATGNMGDAKKAQTTELKSLNLVTCKESVIDKISNNNGEFGDVELTLFNKSLVAIYKDQQKVNHAKVYSVANSVTPLYNYSVKSLPDFVQVFGYREDTKTVVGKSGDQFLTLVTGSLVTTSKKNLAATLTGQEGDYAGFLIP